MIDEFYASVKLTTGEELIGYIELYEDGITITEPLVLEDMSMFEDIIDNPHATGLKLSKWIKSSTEEIFFIRDDKIITIADLNEMGIRTYKKALVDIAKTNQKLKKQAIRSNNKIRYEGSKQNINEARSKFENLFNEY
jgi:hypothetical protein